MFFRRFAIAFKLALFGFLHPELFAENIFVMMSGLLENCFKVVNEDKPYTTHLLMGDKRIVSFWMYPGLSKNPTDRIIELLNEINALKEIKEV